MEETWERQSPIYNLSLNEAGIILGEEVVKLEPVNIGLRNSNYKVSTKNNTYFLRISKGYQNEVAAFNLIKDEINMPKLLYMRNQNDKKYLVYEYIEAESLQTKDINLNIVIQCAKSLSVIHNHTVNDEFIKLDYPPFEKWYDLFLDNKNCSERLGDKIVFEIKEMLKKRYKDIIEINKYNSLIHGDFKLSNLMIDKYNKVYITDFEFCNYGHILADIGQFFREEEKFSKSYIEVFEKVYNKYAVVKLPENWYSLSKLRDLINPLQLLTSEGEANNKNRDLIELVRKYL